MFSFTNPNVKISPEVPPAAEDKTLNKHKALIQSQNIGGGSNNGVSDLSALDELLENEKVINTSKTWNKLDNTQKTQKLHAYAERYVNDHGMPIKEVKALKTFLSQMVYSGKLQKTKEVLYNKDTREIVSIPVLHFSVATHTFYLAEVGGEPKQNSTLKSLTPKRVSEKNLPTSQM